MNALFAFVGGSPAPTWRSSFREVDHAPEGKREYFKRGVDTPERYRLTFLVDQFTKVVWDEPPCNRNTPLQLCAIERELIDAVIDDVPAPIGCPGW
ncbi:MAG: hypothetical protein ACHREM_11545 [Polyangiales bacterium]